VKFRDGYRQIRKEFEAFHFVEVRDAAWNESSLAVYTASKPVKNRGDTLDGVLITAEFSAPQEDILHIRMYHHKGGLPPRCTFDLPVDRPGGIAVSETGEEYAAASGALSVRIAKARTAEGIANPWSCVFYRSGKKLTEIKGRFSGYFRGGTSSGEAYMVQYLGLSVGETVYGLGERFTAFVKNGQAVDIWNEDGGTASEQAYKNIPFYISSRGYGVLVNNPGRVSFEAGSELVSAVQFSVPGEVIDYYVIAGSTLKDVIKNYTALSGRPALPPAWSFGLWLSTSFLTDYDEKTVTRFVDGMAERKIPLSVFHFDSFWMKEYQWVDFQWDEGRFPDPAGMLRRLKGKGLKICLWINPYIAQKSPLFDEGTAKGFLVKRPDGSVWQWDRWQAGMGLVDFTNPAAVDWYRGKLKALLDMGVDTFKTDFGEWMPADAAWYNGAEPGGMHNFYTFLYNRAVFTLLEETRGKGEALVFARSASVGSQRFPLHWGGDCVATYESMAETLRGGLSLALSGFAFWSHDIGGFENTATPDLFKRWIAFGLLSSHSRLHGSDSYRVPWNYDDEACGILRFFVNLKCSLMPYIYRCAVEANREGLPLLRPMILEFPDDPACACLDLQYLLGDSLLAAPVFSEDGEVSYYLPAGRWTDFITGETAEGGAWQTERHGYQSLPLMARPGSIIAVGNNTDLPDYDYANGVSFHVFEAKKGVCLKASVPNLRGETEMEICVTLGDREYTVEKAGVKKPWRLVFRNLHRGAVSRAAPEGVRAEDSPQGLVVSVNAKVEKFTVEL
jgi:alpha-D-xyloside xylohydrolase